MIKPITVDEIVNIINTTWDGVDKSILGPIVRDNVEIKHVDDEAWKPAERTSIMNMASYETYKIVLGAQLKNILDNREKEQG